MPSSAAEPSRVDPAAAKRDRPAKDQGGSDHACFATELDAANDQAPSRTRGAADAGGASSAKVSDKAVAPAANEPETPPPIASPVPPVELSIAIALELQRAAATPPPAPAKPGDPALFSATDDLDAKAPAATDVIAAAAIALAAAPVVEANAVAKATGESDDAAKDEAAVDGEPQADQAAAPATVDPTLAQALAPAPPAASSQQNSFPTTDADTPSGAPAPIANVGIATQTQPQIIEAEADAPVDPSQLAALAVAGEAAEGQDETDPARPNAAPATAKVEKDLALGAKAETPSAVDATDRPKRDAASSAATPEQPAIEGERRQTESASSEASASPAAYRASLGNAAPAAPDLGAPSAPAHQPALQTAAGPDAGSSVATPPSPVTPTPTAPIHLVPMTIGLQALDGAREFQIRLTPDDLGRVDVKLTISEDGRVAASLVVDRVETLSMLQRDARTLERAFDQAGLTTDSESITISLRQDQTGQQRNGEDRDDTPFAPPNAHIEIETPVDVAALRQWRNPAATGGVDIRV